MYSPRAANIVEKLLPAIEGVKAAFDAFHGLTPEGQCIPQVLTEKDIEDWNRSHEENKGTYADTGKINIEDCWEIKTGYITLYVRLIDFHSEGPIQPEKTIQTPKSLPASHYVIIGYGSAITLDPTSAMSKAKKTKSGFNKIRYQNLLWMERAIKTIEKMSRRFDQQKVQQSH
ncbi:MAG: hypothetical protein KF744_08015 [Taibaiella sp.]|nr:hypothetical protein [Taibaiella sp.]